MTTCGATLIYHIIVIKWDKLFTHNFLLYRCKVTKFLRNFVLS